MKCFELAAPSQCCLYRCPPREDSRSRQGALWPRGRLLAFPACCTPWSSDLAAQIGLCVACTLQPCPPGHANTGGNSDEIRYPCESGKWFCGWFLVSDSLDPGTRCLTQVASVVLPEKVASFPLPPFSLTRHPHSPFLFFYFG